METLIKMAPVISAIMPLIVILITGIWVNNRIEKLKDRLQMNQSIIQKRAEFYSKIQDDLNNIYSYIKRVGSWKNQTPISILQSKRLVDQKFHTTKPYWSKNTMSEYQKFMAVCFQTYRGHGLDAGIRAEVEHYKTLQNWESSFSDSFVSDFNSELVGSAYDKFMDALSKDFGLS